MEGTFAKKVNIMYMYIHTELTVYKDVNANLLLKTNVFVPLSLLYCRDTSLANARLSFERALADKEALESQLNESASMESSMRSEAEKKVSSIYTI